MWTTAHLAADAPLKINWAEMPTYNTIMAVAAGAGLLLTVELGRRLVAPARSCTPRAGRWRTGC
ncbi:hypothetical protein ACFQHO_36195 [Actinomadura yumaensis]|uniref:hypothetical protein n=1 Tax=Actinomadura yumaensis TaxID=111807 RepID=UPI003621C96B